jgi:hypothetical protein
MADIILAPACSFDLSGAVFARMSGRALVVFVLLVFCAGATAADGDEAEDGPPGVVLLHSFSPWWGYGDFKHTARDNRL